MKLASWVLVMLVAIALPAGTVHAAPPEAADLAPQVPPLVGVCIELETCAPTNSDPSTCRLWEWYGTEPDVTLNPLLGLIIIDPDGCLRNKVEDALDLVPLEF